MKVLITGGMGVIGAETSRKFVKEGHRPVVFARHRRIAYRGDWARAIRRGGWVFLVTALFVVLRLNKVFSPEIGLFILALVVVAEATLSVER